MLTADERDRLNAIRRTLRSRQALIDSDTALSSHGKRVRKAREQLAAEAEHKRIVEAANARTARELRDSYFRSFGMKNTSADGIRADRQARDRAAKLTSPGDAMRALAAAEVVGDTGMARAIAEVAWKNRGEADVGGHWHELLVAYAEADPERNAALGALAEAADSGGVADRLYADPLARPPDLQQGSIEALAAESLEPQLTEA